MKSHWLQIILVQTCHFLPLNTIYFSLYPLFKKHQSVFLLQNDKSIQDINIIIIIITTTTTTTTTTNIHLTTTINFKTEISLSQKKSWIFQLLPSYGRNKWLQAEIESWFSFCIVYVSTYLLSVTTVICFVCEHFLHSYEFHTGLRSVLAVTVFVNNHNYYSLHIQCVDMFTMCHRTKFQTPV